MITTTIWHNPRCSKSRQTLALIEEKGITPQIRLYLQDTPGIDEIKQALAMLQIEPLALMRTKDDLFKELGLSKDTSAETLIAAMADNPKLIERPLVIRDGKARLGRPPESVLELL